MTPLKITAGMVAAELRRLADALDREPDAEVPNVQVYFHPAWMADDAAQKEQFLAVARLMPRPYTKSNYGENEIKIEHENGGFSIWSKIERSKTCKLIRPATPAVYDCLPLLSAGEEAQLEGAA